MSSNTKKIYYFNPGHENAILNGSPYYTAPANIVKMQQDLQYLPAWYADHDDLVFVEKKLPEDFTAYLRQNIVSIPEAVTVEQIPKNASVHLWGVSPQAIHHFKEISEANDLNLGIPLWNDEIKYLSSREESRDCLLELTKNIPEISDSIIPKFFSDLNSIDEFVSNSPCQLLAKAPFSSSGRGLLWLPKEGLTRTEKQILHGILKKQGVVSIEKALDKVIDFAMEFHLSNTGVASFLGYSLFSTSPKGSYIGNYMNKNSDILSSISHYTNIKLLVDIQENIQKHLENYYSCYYSGCVGIDMMIYKHNDSYSTHPCLEINLRDNMGLVALNISERYLAEDSEGMFYIDFSPQENEILNRHIDMAKKNPAYFVSGKIKSGYLSLCPITTTTKYRAYILVQQQSSSTASI